MKRTLPALIAPFLPSFFCFLHFIESNRGQIRLSLSAWRVQPLLFSVNSEREPPRMFMHPLNGTILHRDSEACYSLTLLIIKLRTKVTLSVSKKQMKRRSCIGVHLEHCCSLGGRFNGPLLGVKRRVHTQAGDRGGKYGAGFASFSLKRANLWPKICDVAEIRSPLQS